MGDRHLDRWFRKYRDRGDVEALGRLFDAAAPELGRIAAHLCRDTSEAEDVLQATFLTAMERAESWDPTRRFLPWATGILANHARSARRRRVHASPPPDDEPGSPEPGPSSRAADREFRSAIGTAVDELPESYRDFMSEIRRRRAYGGAVTSSSTAMMDRLASMREDEVKAREKFLRGSGRHLMPAFFEIFAPTLATPPPLFTPQLPAMVEMDTLPDVGPADKPSTGDADGLRVDR